MAIRFKIGFLVTILALVAVFISMSLPFGGALGDAKPFLPGEIDESNGRLVDATFYAKNYGVTVEEALRRFNLEDAARPVEAELTEKERDTFAGLWVKHTPEFRIVIQFNRNGADTVKPYIRGELADFIEVRTVKYSYIELQKSHQEYVSSLRNLGFVSDSYVDIINNRVVFNIAQSDQARFDSAVESQKLTLHDSIKVVYVEALLKPVIDIYGGLSISTCTTGFSVITWGGTKGIVTAGHAQNGQWFNIIFPLNFQQELVGGNYDVQWHTCPLLTVKNKIRWWSDGSTFDITLARSRTTQLVGETVSKYAVFPFYLATTASPGTHKVEFTYEPNRLKVILVEF